LIIGDGVDETRPKKRHSQSGKRQRKKKIQEPKAEIVLPEPDQDDMDVL